MIEHFLCKIFNFFWRALCNVITRKFNYLANSLLWIQLVYHAVCAYVYAYCRSHRGDSRQCAVFGLFMYEVYETSQTRLTVARGSFVKFAWWQHPAMGAGKCLLCLLYYVSRYRRLSTWYSQPSIWPLSSASSPSEYSTLTLPTGRSLQADSFLSASLESVTLLSVHQVV